ncbi:hypothetical protein MMC29_004404, partial [Sticta canariensis]|nr:hypothetical protein [Sticta canariensis]
NAAAKIIKKGFAVTLMQPPEIHSSAYWMIAQELERPAAYVRRLLNACITLRYFLNRELRQESVLRGIWNDSWTISSSKS